MRSLGILGSMRTNPNHRSAWLLLGAAASVYAAVIWWGRVPHRVAYDQLLYHSAAIAEFVQQWPRPDLSDYLSATTPGLHLAMAWLTVTFSVGVVAHQLVCAVLTLVLIATLLWFRPSRQAGPQIFDAIGGQYGWGMSRVGEVISVLPFVTSIYVFASAVWVLPDNAAWLGVLVMLLLSLAPTLSVQTVLFSGLTLTALVLTRQVHVWTAGPLLARCFLEGLRADGRPLLGAGWSPRPGLGRASVHASFALLACLPAVLVLVYFYGIWGGLTPPTFQQQYHATNLAGPAWMLSLLGFVSLFFIGYLLPGIIEGWRRAKLLLVLGGIVGVIVSILPRTSAGLPSDYFAGRRTGLWDVAALVPELGGYASPVIILFAGIGGVVLTSLLMHLRLPQVGAVLSAFAGYSLALAAGGELWQRYGEPFILMMMVILLRFAGADRERLSSTYEKGGVVNWVWIPRIISMAALGPLLLSAAFVALNVRDIRKPGSQLLTQPAPPAETASATVPNPRPDSPHSRYMISKGRLKPRANVQLQGAHEADGATKQGDQPQ